MDDGKKEIKLSNNEHDYILWAVNKIQDYTRLSKVLSVQYSEFLDQILKKHNENPEDKSWDIDIPKGIIFRKENNGSNSNSNKPE